MAGSVFACFAGLEVHVLPLRQGQGIPARIALLLTTAGFGLIRPAIRKFVFTPACPLRYRTAYYVATHPSGWTFEEESVTVPCMNAERPLQENVSDEIVFYLNQRQ